MLRILGKVELEWYALASGGPVLISKTTFLEFQMCLKNAWLKLHKPER
jgi:hypothetical protein